MEEETNNHPPQMPADQMKQPVASTFGQHDHESPSHLGIVLGILVVVLISIVGGLYLWGSDMVENVLPKKYLPSEQNVKRLSLGSNQIQAINETVDSSGLSESEIDFILTDLETVALDLIDAELGMVVAVLDNLEAESDNQEEPPPPPES